MLSSWKINAQEIWQSTNIDCPEIHFWRCGFLPLCFSTGAPSTWQRQRSGGWRRRRRLRSWTTTPTPRRRRLSSWTEDLTTTPTAGDIIPLYQMICNKSFSQNFEIKTCILSSCCETLNLNTIFRVKKGANNWTMIICCSFRCNWNDTQFILDSFEDRLCCRFNFNLNKDVWGRGYQGCAGRGGTGKVKIFEAG